MKLKLSCKTLCTVGFAAMTVLPTISQEVVFPKPGYNWVGDVMAVENDSKVEFNYLFETDHNGPGYHPIYRFTTEDFCTYEDVGEVLPLGSDSYKPDFSIGTGSFVKADGIYHCFYTGHNDRAGEYQMDKEVLMHATSTDNIHWKKNYAEVIHAPDGGYSHWDFRDPQVVYMQEEGKWWMLVSGRKDGADFGTILLYKSKNLKRWTFSGELYSDKYWMMECPDLFKIGDWYYLTFSWENVTHYRMSKDLKNWQRPSIETFDGNAFYAAKSFKFGDKRYLAGFIDRKPFKSDAASYLWAGNLCSYELSQKADGTLGVKMPEQLENKCFTTRSDSLKDIPSVSGTAQMGELPASLLMSANVKFTGTNGQVEFKFGGKNGYSIVLNQSENSISYKNEFPNSQSFKFEKGKTYSVKMIVENEIIVVYVDDTAALSNRIYKAPYSDWSIKVSDAAEFTDVSFRVH